MKNKLKLLVCALGASLSLGAVASTMPDVLFRADLNEQTTVFARPQGGDTYTEITSLGNFQQKRFRWQGGYLESLGFATGDAIEVKFQNEQGSSKICRIRRLIGGYLGFTMNPGRTDPSLTLEQAYCTTTSDVSQTGSQVELKKEGAQVTTQLLVKIFLRGDYKYVMGPAVAYATESGWTEEYPDIDLQPALKAIRPNEQVMFAVTDTIGKVFLCGHETIFQGKHSFVFDGYICTPG